MTQGTLIDVQGAPVGRSAAMHAVPTPLTARAPLIAMPVEKVTALVEAVADRAPISGLSHGHYRYPARFSPRVAKGFVDAFTEPGDLVCDPFLGGGTTAVEASTAARDFVGCDISTLANFVADAKCRLYSDAAMEEFHRWVERVPNVIDMRAPTPPPDALIDAGYLRNLEGPKLWRLRKALRQVVGSLEGLPENARVLARCTVLRAAQTSLEHRRAHPSVAEFRRILQESAEVVEDGSRLYGRALDEAAHRLGRRPTVACLARSAVGLELDPAFAGRAPKLVLTSPPYPGVHVLYHRWQVDGRRESPLPFWIANRLDGSGESYYTLGYRGNPGLQSYFAALGRALGSIAAISDEQTTLVQVVAFSEPEWQLPRYLEVARTAGWEERLLSGIDSPDGRLWRNVPNRKWYADLKGPTAGSFEVVLLHTLLPVAERQTS